MAVLVFFTQLLISCHSVSNNTRNPADKYVSNASRNLIEDSTVYQTKNLIVRRLSPHVYVHISFLNTLDFGKVPSNGMLVVNNHEAIIFDTPSDNESSEELIRFVTSHLHCKVNAVIPTHFHADCVGGLEKFNEYDIPSYASKRTIELLRKKGELFSKPIQSFDSLLTLHAGGQKVFAIFYGEGHTKDNIIGYFPEDRVVFGGCLIKETGASKGNLEDANVVAWPKTVEELKKEYRHAKVVIPGHGQPGGTELFDYTIHLFK